MTEKKKMEVVFAPGCFDHFDGTQDELDQLIKEIQEHAENGTLFENSNPVSIENLLEELSEEEVENLLSTVEGLELDGNEELGLANLNGPRRTLQ
jgi:hypothetical protein